MKWPAMAAAAAIIGLTKMSATAASLAAFKIAVAGGGATFARIQDVGIHSQTHGAA